MKIKSLFFFLTLFGAVGAFAQSQDISDTELAQFADAYINVQMQNQEAQEQMITIIEAEGLDVEKFSAIQQSSLNPDQDSGATAEEMKKHDEAMAKIEKLQPELERKAIKGIESAGITMDKYESLASAIQQDQGLQQRLQTILMERQQ